MEKRNTDMEKEKRYWIKEGMEVSHREMNGQKMIVDRIVYKKVDFKKEDEGNEEYSVRRLQGVECHWISEEGKYQNGRFHTKELVPYDVIMQGQEALKRWDISRLNK